MLSGMSSERVTLLGVDFDYPVEFIVSPEQVEGLAQRYRSYVAFAEKDSTVEMRANSRGKAAAFGVGLILLGQADVVESPEDVVPIGSIAVPSRYAVACLSDTYQLLQSTLSRDSNVLSTEDLFHLQGQVRGYEEVLSALGVPPLSP